jgi:hypothetical protein
VSQVEDREKTGEIMASTATPADFVSLVAQEIAFGIDHALDHWLGRIEMELVDAKLTNIERLRAIELILREYKEVSGKTQLSCASA